MPAKSWSSLDNEDSDCEHMSSRSSYEVVAVLLVGLYYSQCIKSKVKSLDAGVANDDTRLCR